MRKFYPLWVLSFCLLLLFGCLSMGNAAEDAISWMRGFKAPKMGEAYSHYITSIMLSGRGQDEGALAEMERVLQVDSDSVTPTLQLVRVYLKIQDFERALELSQRAVEQVPERMELHVVMGQIHQQLNQNEEAEAAFEKAIAINPESGLGYDALVRLQESMNDLVRVVDVYKRLIKLNPNSAMRYYQLGLSLVRIGETEGAKRALERSSELEPNLLLARKMLGVLHLETGESAKSVAQLQYYLRRRPQDFVAAENLAGALARMGRYNDAIDVFSTILSGGQSTPGHHINAMYVSLLAGDPKGAELLAPTEGADIFSALLVALARQADGNLDRTLLDRLDTMKGDLDAECLNYLNGLLYLYGSEQTGMWFLDKLDGLAKSRTLDIIRARTRMNIGRYKEAIYILDSVLARMTPKEDVSPSLPRKQVHYYLAVSHEELDHFEETEHHLRAYLARDPDDPDVLNFLGYLYAEANVKLKQATRLLGKALETDPESPYYLDSLGWVYYRQGKADKALESIQRAVYRMEGDDAILRDHLGDAYMLKGDVKRAIAQWERARRLDPKLEGVKEKLNEHRKD